MSYALTSKSQVTLPKAIREHLKVAPGDAVDFRIVADGTVRVVPAQTATSTTAADAAPLKAARKRFAALRGSGSQHGQPSTDALMQLLRGYDGDGDDPGLAMPPAGPKRLNSPKRPAKPKSLEGPEGPESHKA